MPPVTPTPQVNMYDQYRNDVEAIERSVVNITGELNNQLYAINQNYQSFVRYKDVVKETKTIYTDVNSLSDDLLMTSTRLGNSLVDKNTLLRIGERLNTAELKLNSQLVGLDNARNTALQDIANILQSNNIAVANNLSSTQDIQQAIQDTNVEIQRLQSNQSALTPIELQRLQTLKEQYAALNAQNLEYDESRKFIIDAINKINELKTQQDALNNKVDQGNALYKKTKNDLTVMSRLLQGISKIPVIGQLFDMQQLADSATKGIKPLTKDLWAQTKELLSSTIVRLGIAAFLWSKIIGYIKQGVELAKEYDKVLTDTANRLAFSKEATKVLYENFYEVSQSGKDLNGGLYSGFVTMKNMGAAMGSLQDAFGTSAFINEKMLKDQILMTKQIGLTEEEAAGVQKYSVLTGKSAVNIIDSLLKQNKHFISNKKLIAEIAKVNSEIATSYKNQPELLAKAAVQAMKLGMTLEDTRKISDSLLNFETSIESELKAELLLGKQLNYEKARSLALEGKSAEAAAELIKQTGGLNELNKLNVINRKALAESIGLSSEELTKYAQQEEILSKLGTQSVKDLEERHKLLMDQGKVSEANALLESVRKQQNGELLAQDIAKASLAARYEASMDKVKEIFVKMAEPLIKVLEVVLKLIENLAVVKGFAIGIASALTAAAVAFSALTLGAAPAAALAIGGAFGLGAGIYTGVSVNDAAISPSKGLMIATPKGEMFRTNPDDNVYATPKSPSEMMSRTTTVPQKSTLPKEEMSAISNEKTIIQKQNTMLVNREKESFNKFDNTEVVAVLKQIKEKMSQQVNIDSQALTTIATMSANFSYA